MSNTMTLLCLHGWGGSKDSFHELRDALRGSSIIIHAPNLPGFGNEPEPPIGWTNDDYAAWVEQYAKENDIGHCHVIGHSHGGRIAIKLATRGTLKIDHLYLCAAAGIKRPRHLKRTLGLVLAKSGKFLLTIPLLNKFQPLGKKFLYKLVRVHDYERASDRMRKTMILVARENLRPLLKDIHIPTDIFWGKDDTMTPYDDAIIMNAEIAQSTLHSFAGVRHRVHRDRADAIASVIRARIGDI